MEYDCNSEIVKLFILNCSFQIDLPGEEITQGRTAHRVTEITNDKESPKVLAYVFLQN
jgi:hypothetical protein